MTDTEENKTEPVNHVLEVQDGEIDLSFLFRQLDKSLNKITEVKEDGKVSPQ